MTTFWTISAGGRCSCFDTWVTAAVETASCDWVTRTRTGSAPLALIWALSRNTRADAVYRSGVRVLAR